MGLHLSEKVAVVTGASKGIGLEVAPFMVPAGCHGLGL